MYKEFTKALEQKTLLPESGPIVAAVSGGPDSLCLLHLLKTVVKDHNLSLEIHVAHLNHGLRDEADEDESFVRSICHEWGLPFHSRKVDVKASAGEKKQTLEEAAREVRYAFLRECARKLGASAIYVAHNADDQAETILMHLIRGSGLSGLRGMKVRDKDLIRPLLNFTRAEIEDYCEEQHLAYRIDATNFDTHFTRNRIRHELLPLLKTYSPNIVGTLLRTGAVISNELEFIDQSIELFWREGVVFNEWENSYLIEINTFKKLHQVQQYRIISRCGFHLAGSDPGFTISHLAAIEKLISAHAGKEICLPGNLLLYRDYDSLILTFITASNADQKAEQELLLKIPGQVHLVQQNALITAQKVDDSSLASLKNEPKLAGESKDCVYIDASSNALTVRFRKPGDVFQPLGMKQAKKLQDFMVDSKIPGYKRDSTPLVCLGEDIIWVAGYQISERYKITDTTMAAIQLRLISKGTH